MDERSQSLWRPKNRYFIMRHGQSQANVEFKINSDHRQLISLTAEGMEQSAEAARSSVLSTLGSDALIYSSQFPRAKQTALIVSEMLDAEVPTINKLLNERGFGDFEGSSTDNYQAIWDLDQQGEESYRELRSKHVELTKSVGRRAAHLIAMKEYEHKGRDIVFVSHGDTLQIMQAFLSGIGTHRHREVPHLDTAEVRRLN